MRKTIKSLLLVLVVLLTFTGCKMSASKVSDYASNSTKEATTITSDIKAYDSSIMIYQYVNQISLKEDGSAEVTKKTTTLGSSFELETNETKENVSSVSRDELFKLNLDESLLSDVEANKDSFTFTVSKENINSVLNVTNLTILENAKCVMNFSDKKITTIMMTFKTASGKDVEVNISYLY